LVAAAIFAVFNPLGATAALLDLGGMTGMLVVAASPAALRVGLGGRRNGQRRRTGG
jgi:hypothetical protein